MRRPDYDRYLEDLAISREGGILTLSLNNPPMNANTEPIHWALSRIWDDIEGDPDGSVVIFTAVGERAFSAGGDPEIFKRNIGNAPYWNKVSGEAARIIYGMLACNKPVIARLNGHAVGFGATLALASDIIVGVEGASFGDPHCSVGLACGDGGALLWPQQIGYARAREFLFTGRLIKMEEAAEIGLINYAVPREELDAKVMELANEMVNGAGRAIQLTKAVLNLPLRQAALATMDFGMANETLSSQSEDHNEAVTAMIEKRKPEFTGR